jgi:hypothetical protein
LAFSAKPGDDDALSMERLDFYKLSRPVQERFIGSVNGTGLPSPILEWRVTPNEPRIWLALSVGAALVVAGLFRLGHGNLESAFAIQPLPMAAAYVAFAAASVYGLLHAMKIWGEIRGLPFKPGVYIFPVGLIDARRQWLRVHKIGDLVSVEGPDANNAFRIRFGGTIVTMAARDDVHAVAAKESLAQARTRVQHADSARDSVRPKELAALDPLHGVVNPLVSSVPISRPAPPWAKLDWLVAIVLGFAVGSSLWAIHNAHSDDKMYAGAAEANDVASYRAYLSRGSRHREEVANILLPRAELKQAESAGNVQAVERYIKEHPATGIPAEVSGALRKALVAELEAAKQAGTLAALTEFAQQHPDHHLETELRAARHAVYQAALESYKKSAPAKGDAIPFVERLLAYAEKKGPSVQVRFHRTQPKSMEKADAQVAKNRFFNGVVSLPSRYFDLAHERPREAALGNAIVARFAQAFAPEILTFSIGPSIDDPEAPLPPPTAPTIFIEHNADWTGGQATSAKPRGIWVSIAFNYNVSFQIPEDPKPRLFKTAVFRGPDPSDGKDEDKPEDKIYETMAKAAIDQLTKRYLATFFAPPPSTAK